MRARIHRNITIVALGSSVFFLPFSVAACHLAIAVAVLNILTEGNWPQKVAALRSRPAIFILPIFYVLHIAGMVYTSNTSVGWMKLETKLIFLILPLTLVTSPLVTRKETVYMAILFVVACFAGTIICLVHSTWSALHHVSFVNFGNSGLDTYEALNPGVSGKWMYFTYIGLASGIDLHPTYFGLYLISCQLILVYLYSITSDDKAESKKRYLILALYIYLLGFTMMLSSRIITISNLLVVSAAMIYLLKRHGRSAATIVIAITVFALVILSVNPVSRYRGYHEIMSTTLTKQPPAMADNSFSIRVSLWWLALRALGETNLLTGVGTGDADATMKEVAGTFNAHNVLDTYDPHNQFVHTLLSLGAVGLIVLMICFVTFLVMTWRKKHYVCFGFLCVFVLVCLTESALEVQKGIVLFTLFISGYSWLSRDVEYPNQRV